MRPRVGIERAVRKLAQGRLLQPLKTINHKHLMFAEYFPQQIMHSSLALRQRDNNAHVLHEIAESHLFSRDRSPVSPNRAQAAQSVIEPISQPERTCSRTALLSYFVLPDTP
jgi:hypothetical protein